MISYATEDCTAHNSIVKYLRSIHTSLTTLCVFITYCLPPHGLPSLLSSRPAFWYTVNYQRTDLLEMFKMLIGKASPAFDTLFTRSTISSTRGHSVKLVKHRCNVDLQKYFLSERVIDRWNQLSEDCVTCDTVNKFNGKLEKTRKDKMDFFKDRT